MESFRCLPQLRYGIAFLGFISAKDMKVLFRLPKRTIRCISSLHYRSHYKHLFLRHNIMTPYSIFLLEVLPSIHKNRDSFRLLYDIHTYDTRKSGSIYLPQPHNSLMLNSVYYRGLTYYNLLGPL